MYQILTSYIQYLDFILNENKTRIVNYQILKSIVD